MALTHEQNGAPESGNTTPPAAELDRQRGWVRREIARLNPEVDYERIMYLIAEWEYNEFSVNLGYAVQFQHVMIPVPGSDVLTGTGKVINRRQTRFFDSTEFAAGFMLKGPSHPDTKKATERLNAIHAGVAKKFPASFEKTDDWIYTFSFLVCQNDRMRDLVGAPRQTRARQVAQHHFWRDIAAQMHGPNGGSFAEDFPATYEDAEDFLNEFEARDWAPTPKGRIVSDAIIQQFNEKYLPRPLYPVGKAIVLAFVNERVRQRHQIPPVNPVLMALVRGTFRVVFTLQDRMPERKTPFSEDIASEKYKERRRTWRKRERTAAAAPHPAGCPAGVDD